MESEISESIRILIIGDNNVGKSYLSALLTSSPTPSKYTIGVNINILIHNFKTKLYSLILLDVPPSSSRSMFYTDIHAIIAVHDTTNSKSHANLWRHLSEVLNSPNFGGLDSVLSVADDGFKIGAIQTPIPILVVGTKIDLSPSISFPSSDIAREYGGDEVLLDASISELDPQTKSKFDGFWDKVIWKRYFDGRHQQLQYDGFVDGNGNGWNQQHGYMNNGCDQRKNKY